MFPYIETKTQLVERCDFLEITVVGDDLRCCCGSVSFDQFLSDS